MSTVHSIFIAPQATGETQSVAKAELIAGKGVVGDRYYLETGTFSEQLSGQPDRELTLIESEQIDRFNAEQGFSFSYGDFRRNIVTQGVDLNELAGKEFRIGSVRVRRFSVTGKCVRAIRCLHD